MAYPKFLEKMMLALRCLPGVGKKTAERYALHLLEMPSSHLENLGGMMQNLKKEVTHCNQCGAICDKDVCQICSDPKRDQSILSIVSSPREILAIETMNNYNGIYHVLNTLISPIDGFAPKNLHVDKLLNRINQLKVTEVILALDASVEGDATALYLKQQLAPYSLQLSRLAFGLPLGSSLDFVDQGTLAKAYSGRNEF